MTRTTPITSRDNPGLKRLIKLRRSPRSRRDGLFVAEGEREIARALQAGLQPTQFWWSPEPRADAGADAWAKACPAWLSELVHAVDVPSKAPGAKFFPVPTELLAPACYVQSPSTRPALAVFEEPEATLSALPDSAWAGPILVAVGTEKPGNLGAMVRSADVLGASAVVAVGDGVDPFHANAVRASTGAVFTVPLAIGSVSEVQTVLAERGVRLAAAVVEGGEDPRSANWSGAWAIAIGPEHKGLDPAWVSAADRGLTIPNQGQTADSLNASVAAAVLLYAAGRA